MRWKRMAAVAVLMTMAGCGGGSSEEDPKDTATYESTAELGRALDCQNYQSVPKPDRVILVTDQGSCRAGGEKIYLFVFKNNEDRDRYIGFSSVFGYVRLLGNRWVIQGSRPTLQELRSDVGGDIVPPVEG